ncbi:hypothetical protein BaRGS_00014107 [Batillaria attramentaria]|uniref:Uncharacterized protein n=1 Tax=Batillaria attramentaria TaxID=370345 RepID=A0ABD0L6N6_9CAEN
MGRLRKGDNKQTHKQGENGLRPLKGASLSGCGRPSWRYYHEWLRVLHDFHPTLRTSLAPTPYHIQIDGVSFQIHSPRMIEFRSVKTRHVPRHGVSAS